MQNRVISWSCPVLGEVFEPWVTPRGHGGCCWAHATSLCSPGSCPGGQRWPGAGNAARGEEAPATLRASTLKLTRFQGAAPRRPPSLRTAARLGPPRTRQSTVSCERDRRASWRDGVWYRGGCCMDLENLWQRPKIWPEQKGDLSEEAQRGRRLCMHACFAGAEEKLQGSIPSHLLSLASSTFSPLLHHTSCTFFIPVVWNSNVAFTCLAWCILLYI